MIDFKPNYDVYTFDVLLSKLICLNLNALLSFEMSLEYIVDSDCTAHMTYDHSVFSAYTKIDLSAYSTADAVVKEEITLTLIVEENQTKCVGVIKNVNHMPKLRYQLL